MDSYRSRILVLVAVQLFASRALESARLQKAPAVKVARAAASEALLCRYKLLRSVSSTLVWMTASPRVPSHHLVPLQLVVPLVPRTLW